MGSSTPEQKLSRTESVHTLNLQELGLLKMMLREQPSIPDLPTNFTFKSEFGNVTPAVYVKRKKKMMETRRSHE